MYNAEHLKQENGNNYNSCLLMTEETDQSNKMPIVSLHKSDTISIDAKKVL